MEIRNKQQLANAFQSVLYSAGSEINGANSEEKRWKY